jgi:hypothetical protein
LERQLRDFRTILAKFWTYIAGEEQPRRFEERKAEQNSPDGQTEAPPAPISPGEVKAELQRILSSPTFRNAPRHTEFLRFVVGKALAGEAETVKEYLVGLEVFHRRSDYDPAIDPIVRAEARRLRERLIAYYGTLGELDEIRIELPKGTYVPVFSRSRAARPIEFYSCFISYSTKDEDFATRLYSDLQGKRVRCWFAPHDIKSGVKLGDQIDEAIRLHDKLLLILSEHSMKSEWVKTEIAKARKREVKDGNRVLFPVRLVGFEELRDWECFDGDTGKDSAREIREFFIPDFSNWDDDDSYQTAFQRLVKDLKAETNR